MVLVAGVDSSTQSTKVEVRDADTGALVATGRAGHPAVEPPRSEQDPAAWEAAMQTALADAQRSAGGEIAAVAVAGQQHGMVVLDAEGTVIRPAKLWNDTESAPEADALVHALAPAEWAAAAGSVPLAAFTVTKLAWLRAHEPDAYARLAQVLLPHDWLTYRLTGRYTTDRGDASGTGYWSPAEGRYRTDLLALVDPDADWEPRLPEVLGPVDTVGRTRGLTALPDGVVVAPGTGDNMGGALGLALQPGDVAISLGTSGTVYAVSDRPTADPTGLVAGFADASGEFLPLACTLNATRVTDTVATLIGADRAAFDELALSAPPGARGVVLVPYLDGERTPNRPNATGSFTGIRTSTTPAALARAAVEGVVCGLLDALEALEATGVDTGGRLLLIGGGARSAAYRRVVADLVGRPVVVPESTEHVAAGAAAQAAAVLQGAAPAQLAASWGLGDGPEVEPAPDSDADAVRAAYAAARG